jgi:hypothetical protein
MTPEEARLKAALDAYIDARFEAKAIEMPSAEEAADRAFAEYLAALREYVRVVSGPYKHFL